MLKNLFTVIFLLIFSSIFSAKIFAALTYGGGVYTNICGSGTDATFYNCSANCRPGEGFCEGPGETVVKFTCNGRLNECRDGESSWSSRQDFSGAQCGKTYQVDVFDRKCRLPGWQWDSSCQLRGYLVWYSGDCPSNQYPVGFHDGNPNPYNSHPKDLPQGLCVAEGWATDPNNRSTKVDVRVLVNNSQIGPTFKADQFRGDLQSAGVCPGGVCSYKINLWNIFSHNTNIVYKMQARDINDGTWVDLGNTPKTINCVEPTITNTPSPTISPTPYVLPGSIRAKAVINSDANPSCDLLYGAGSMSGPSFSLSPNPGVAPVSIGGYTLWNSITSVNKQYSLGIAPPSGYVLGKTCLLDSSGVWGTGSTAFLDPNEAITWIVSFRPTSGSWFQTVGSGSIYSGSKVKSLLPSSTSVRRFSLKSISPVGTSGFVFYTFAGPNPPAGASNFEQFVDFDPTYNDPGTSFISESKNWLVRQKSNSSVVDFYQTFYQKLGSPTVSNYTGNAKPSGCVPNVACVKYSANSLSINSTPWVINNGEKIIILVNGSLNISRQIKVNNNGFIAFIAKGPISFDGLAKQPTGSSTQGVYITSSDIYTGTSPKEQFWGKGIFIASGNILPQRDIDPITNNTTPSDLFEYDVSYLLNMPSELMDRPYTWEEANP